MNNWGKRTAGIVLVLSVLFGFGVAGASAAPTPAGNVADVASAQETIGPWNSTPATAEEVRQNVSLNDMVRQGFALKDIRKYYPTATNADVVEAKKTALTPTVQPMIVIANCSMSTEFYGVVRIDGSQTCFAYAGTYNGLYITLAKWLCPGNNLGRALYSDIYNNFYWSPWRGPVNPLTYCYQFSANVTVQSVQISY